MDITLEIADLITPMRIKILHALKEEKHPADLARLFNITRQAIDKHLSLLYKFGLIDKRIKAEARPMVFYHLTSEGKELLGNFEDLTSEYVMSIKKRFKEDLFTLDRLLVDSEISEKEYLQRKNTLIKRFEWVIKDDNKKGEKG